MQTISNQNVALTIIESYWGLRGELTSLAGEKNANFRFEAEDGCRYTFKIFTSETEAGHLDLQSQLLERLQAKASDLSFPRLIPTKDQQPMVEVEYEGEIRKAQLLSWVDGTLWAHFTPHTPSLLFSLGEVLGKLSQAFLGYDHPAAHYAFKWDPSSLLWIQPHLALFSGEEHEIITTFLDRFQAATLPQLSALRKSVTYLDANDYNVLIGENPFQPSVKAVIDFGDVHYTHTINELAVAAAYALMHQTDPIEALVPLVKGFHAHFPLTPGEIEVLFSLITARLLISVTCAAQNRVEHPDNAYLSISEKGAWELLKKLYAVSPEFVHYRLRTACNLPAHPKQEKFAQWARQQSFAPVMEIEHLPQHTLDLSVGSKALGTANQYLDTHLLDACVQESLHQASAEVGIGRYLETRPLYTTDSYLVAGNEGPRWRTVHLGLDIFMPPQQPVFAPYDGVVHSLQDNAGDRDYGPTIILEHQADGFSFYTLYGHLSRPSLQGLKVGQKIKQGTAFAALGSLEENGGWPPHLHFQIMLDLLGWQGDFPGVAFPDELATWQGICPDPGLMVSWHEQATPPSPLSKAELVEKRKEFLGYSLSLSYEEPLHIVRGFGPYLYDQAGQRYLDTVNNVPHVGHQHPRVVQAAQRQMAVLNTNTRYLHEEILAYAEELLATFPKPLSVVHFVNSGSEANELALRMARAYSGQQDFVVLEAGYHGNTNACVDISHYKFSGKGGMGAPDWVHVAPAPDTYRGPYQSHDRRAGRKYASHISTLVEQLQNRKKGVAGFICESILSCGGQIVLPPGYLREAYRIIREAGGICIADEVQVGFGRSGEAFWAFELQGVVPDIVTLGKPIGNGHPLGAVICSQEVAQAFDNGMEYFNTFGGNPVSATIGREVLKVVQEENLQQHAREVGAYLRKGLQELKFEFPLIGDVRGPGFFQGIELVRNRLSLEPAAQEATYLANRMRQHGILMSTDGPLHNVLKIKPPMPFSQQDADFLILTLRKILQEKALQVVLPA